MINVKTFTRKTRNWMVWPKKKSFDFFERTEQWDDRPKSL